jgi:hypothetical protein
MPARVWGKSLNTKIEQFLIKFTSEKPKDQSTGEKYTADKNKEQMLQAAKEFRDSLINAFEALKAKKRHKKEKEARFKAAKEKAEQQAAARLSQQQQRKAPLFPRARTRPKKGG